MKKMIIALGLLALSLLSMAQQELIEIARQDIRTGNPGFPCDESNGNASMLKGTSGKALQLLRGCENTESVSGETLVSLAILFSSPEFSDVKGPVQRAQRSYELFVRAALKGNEDAIVILANLFESGELLRSISPQPGKAKCLMDVVDRSESPINADDVKRCL